MDDLNADLGSEPDWMIVEAYNASWDEAEAARLWSVPTSIDDAKE